MVYANKEKDNLIVNCNCGNGDDIKIKLSHNSDDDHIYIKFFPKEGNKVPALFKARFVQKFNKIWHTYQEQFHKAYERWPTWDDAMSDCTPNFEQILSVGLNNLD